MLENWSILTLRTSLTGRFAPGGRSQHRLIVSHPRARTSHHYPQFPDLLSRTKANLRVLLVSVLLSRIYRFFSSRQEGVVVDQGGPNLRSQSLKEPFESQLPCLAITSTAHGRQPGATFLANLNSSCISTNPTTNPPRGIAINKGTYNHLARLGPHLAANNCRKVSTIIKADSPYTLR
jgi:hypothetical protein